MFPSLVTNVATFDPQIAEAMDIIGVNHVPTDNEKEKPISALKTSRQTPFLSRSFTEVANHYLVTLILSRDLPRKFVSRDMGKRKQIKLAKEVKLAERPKGHSDIFSFAAPTGLSIVAILVDCCAGDTRSRVTDVGFAYATLAGLLGSHPRELVEPAEAPYEQLVPITLKVIDVGAIGLKEWSYPG